MGPLKQSLVENFSLQRSNCNIFGHTDTAALFAKEAGKKLMLGNFRENVLKYLGVGIIADRTRSG